MLWDFFCRSMRMKMIITDLFAFDDLINLISACPQRNYVGRYRNILSNLYPQ